MIKVIKVIKVIKAIEAIEAIDGERGPGSVTRVEPRSAATIGPRVVTKIEVRSAAKIEPRVVTKIEVGSAATIGPRVVTRSSPTVTPAIGRRILASLVAVTLVGATPAYAAAPADDHDSAGEAPRIWAAVVPRGPSDTLSPTVDEALRAGIVDGLRREGVTIVEAGAGSLEVACADADCREALADRLGVGYLVRPTLAVAERDYTLRIELYDVRAGKVVDVADERCALCSVAEARQRLEEAAARLVRPLLVPPAEAPRLTLTTTPKGARILVDGVDLGPAPLQRSFSPGPHAIEAIEHDHQRLRHPVELREGERVDVHLVLTPIVKPLPPPKPRFNGWIAIGIGAPIAAGGIALAAVDGNPALGCGTARDGCSTPLESTWPAAAALVVGAALTTLGAVLVHQARRARKASGEPRSARAAKSGKSAKGAAPTETRGDGPAKGDAAAKGDATKR